MVVQVAAGISLDQGHLTSLTVAAIDYFDGANIGNWLPFYPIWPSGSTVADAKVDSRAYFSVGSLDRDLLIMRPSGVAVA